MPQELQEIPAQHQAHSSGLFGGMRPLMEQPQVSSLPRGLPETGTLTSRQCTGSPLRSASGACRRRQSLPLLQVMYVFTWSSTFLFARNIPLIPATQEKGREMENHVGPKCLQFWRSLGRNPPGLSTVCWRTQEEKRRSMVRNVTFHMVYRRSLSSLFLPGESQGQRSLVGCRLWGRTESDTTEATQQHQQLLASTQPPYSLNHLPPQTRYSILLVLIFFAPLYTSLYFVQRTLPLINLFILN